MSLLDALLLDPPKADPARMEVWIAVRTDGQVGSGSQSDPYDGSTLKTLPLAITSFTRSDLVATVVTAVNHGFSVNDVVIISSATANGDWWDGTFQITEVPAANSFKYLLRREPIESAPTGRTVQKPLAYRFDQRMTEIDQRITDLQSQDPTQKSYAAIYIGPGVFETRGIGELTQAFRLRSGYRVLGAGIGLTTLKLVGALDRNRKYAAMGTSTEYLYGLEVADLTIDCNSEGQPSPHVACAAITIQAGGQHIYIHRVRAINAGSHAPDHYAENFVFYFSPAPPSGEPASFDVVIEDCICEDSSPNYHWNNFFFAVAANGENPSFGAVKAENHWPVIRNCFIDARSRYGPIAQIDTIQYGVDGLEVATVTTKSPHGHRRPGNLIVQGASVPVYNGIFSIDAILSETKLTYKPRLSVISPSPGAATGGTTGGLVPSEPVAIDQIVAGSDPNPRQLKLITRDPHYVTSNNKLNISGGFKVGSGFAVRSTALQGTFPVVKYDPAELKQLEFLISSDLDIPLADLDCRASFAKGGHAAMGADNGICENNYVSHISSGGPYADTWSRVRTVARDNYYQNVNIGPFQNLSTRNVSFWIWGAELLSLDYDDTEFVCPTLALHSFAEYENSIITAKLHTSAPSPNPLDYTLVTRHCLLATPGSDNSKVLIFVASGSRDEAAYAGTFTLLEAPDNRTFIYQGNATATVPATAPRFREGQLWMRPLESISVTGPTGGKWTVRATVAPILNRKDHSLETGELVKLKNVGVLPNLSASLNGNFKITAVDRIAGWFEFELTTDPGTVPSNLAPGWYGRIWRCDWFAVESNIFELLVRTLWDDNSFTHAFGTGAYVGGHAPQYIIRQAVVRDNIIRHFNNASDPSKYPTGIDFFGVNEFGLQNGLVQRNIIKLDSLSDPKPGHNSLQYFGSSLATFDNTSPDGTLILARNIAIPTITAPDVTTTVQAVTDEVLLVSLLKL